MVFMRLLVFGIVFVTVVGSAAYYVSQRLAGSFRLNTWQKRLIRFVIAGIVIATPMSITLWRHGFENAAVDWFSWIGYIGLGFLSFLFTFMVMRDISFLVIRGYAHLKNGLSHPE